MKRLLQGGAECVELTLGSLAHEAGSQEAMPCAGQKAKRYWDAGFL